MLYLKRRLPIQLFDDLDFYLGQILSLYEAKYFDQIFPQTFRFIDGQYLAQIKLQIGLVDAALARVTYRNWQEQSWSPTGIQHNVTSFNAIPLWPLLKYDYFYLVQLN